MPRRRAHPRLSPRNVYIADYLVNGLYRLYAITAHGQLLVLEDDEDGDRRHYRDVAADEIEATTADLHLLLDLNDSLTGDAVHLPQRAVLRLLPRSSSALAFLALLPAGGAL